jgi:hypothetical protein
MTINNTRFIAKNGLDNNNQTLINVADPVNAQDAVTKAFLTAQKAAVSLAGTAIDVSLGTMFYKTISTTTTFTVTNVSATGTVSSFVLDLTNGGSAAITWFSGVKWAAGTAPTLTVAGRDLIGFITRDGGTTWAGIVLGLDVK